MYVPKAATYKAMKLNGILPGIGDAVIQELSTLSVLDTSHRGDRREFLASICPSVKI